jgi:hypothetical protein
MAIRASIVSAVLALGLTAESPDQDLKKGYYKAAKAPLTPATLPVLKAALAGDQSAIVADAEAPASKKKAPAAEKTPKEPKVVKAAETPEAALARLKSDPATAERWKRVQRVEQMGKKVRPS